MTAVLSDAVEARGLVLLGRHLERHPLDEHDEFVARAAFLDGFKSGYVRGGRDALDECRALNTMLQDRRFQTALATLVQFLQAEVEG